MEQSPQRDPELRRHDVRRGRAHGERVLALDGFNIPASARSLPRGAGSGGAALPTGAIQGYIDYGTNAYGGPCPPATDTPHHYTFTIYALKVADLGVPPSSTGALVAFNAKSGGNTLGTASFTATYGRGGAQAPRAEPPTTAGLTLASNDVPADGTIPAAQVFNQFGCTGNNISPEIHWSGVPAGTGTLVLTIYDPDAPNVSGFWHWLVFDIPATASGSIAANAGAGADSTPAGGTQGYNDYGFSAYGGPCPPAGAPAHRYVFTLYAIPTSAGTVAAQGASASSTGALIGFITRSLATAKATFTAHYGR
jgi:Raf kinase inhibitor-like YbhB/YbcL family protein